MECRAAGSSRSTAGVVGQDDAGAAHRRRAQKLGGLAAIIDAEHALDPVYAGRLGVNLEELLISQPDTEAQALEIAETLVRSGALDIVVIDSVAALVPRPRSRATWATPMSACRRA